MQRILFTCFFLALSVSMYAQQARAPVTYRNKKDIAEYTGVYDSPKKQLCLYFTSRHDTLFAQYQGGCKDALVPVSKDLFIVKNGEVYYQFHRNRKGNIVSLEFYNNINRYSIHDTEFKTNLPLPKEKHAVAIDIKKLELLRGNYDFGNGFFVPVYVEGNKIYMEVPGEEKEEIFPENENNFFEKKVDGTIEFIKENGKACGMVIKRGGKFEGKKI